jgi:hypothetical protein
MRRVEIINHTDQIHPMLQRQRPLLLSLDRRYAQHFEKFDDRTAYTGGTRGDLESALTQPCWIVR